MTRRHFADRRSPTSASNSYEPAYVSIGRRATVRLQSDTSYATSSMTATMPLAAARLPSGARRTKDTILLYNVRESCDQQWLQCSTLMDNAICAFAHTAHESATCELIIGARSVMLQQQYMIRIVIVIVTLSVFCWPRPGPVGVPRRVPRVPRNASLFITQQYVTCV